MFETISKLYPVDADFPARAQRQILLTAVLNGTLYDIFHRVYHEDRFVVTGDFFPEHRRAPSITSGLAMARASVDTAVGFVFGDAHYPSVDSPDDAVRQALEDFTIDARLIEKMREAALLGSVGSVAIRFRILRQRPHVDVWPTTWLTPTWEPEAPDELASIKELRKVSGEDLRAQGYTIAQDDLGTMHWFQRLWDDAGEWWYVPWPVGRDDDPEVPHIPQVDDQRSTGHNLGFCPFIWIKNLPGGDEVDGECTFVRGIDTLIEIDYRLSGGGRALKYSRDPTLLIKDPLLTDGELSKSSGQALVVGAQGDAKILEMTGHSTKAVETYVEKLRGMALEAIHGVRADPDRIASTVFRPHPGDAGTARTGRGSRRSPGGRRSRPRSPRRPVARRLRASAPGSGSPCPRRAP